jgi:hypothetical protein
MPELVGRTMEALRGRIARSRTQGRTIASRPKTRTRNIIGTTFNPWFVGRPGTHIGMLTQVIGVPLSILGSEPHHGRDEPTLRIGGETGAHRNSVAHLGARLGPLCCGARRVRAWFDGKIHAVTPPVSLVWGRPVVINIVVQAAERQRDVDHPQRIDIPLSRAREAALGEFGIVIRLGVVEVLGELRKVLLRRGGGIVA